MNPNPSAPLLEPRVVLDTPAMAVAPGAAVGVLGLTVVGVAMGLADRLMARRARKAAERMDVATEGPRLRM